MVAALVEVDGASRLRHSGPAEEEMEGMEEGEQRSQISACGSEERSQRGDEAWACGDEAVRDGGVRGSSRSARSTRPIGWSRSTPMSALRFVPSIAVPWPWLWAWCAWFVGLVHGPTQSGGGVGAREDLLVHGAWPDRKPSTPSSRASNLQCWNHEQS